MAADYGKASLRIESVELKALRKQLRQFKDADLKNDLKATNRKAAETVVANARSKAPVRTGKLLDSIRALGGPSGGAIAGGGKRVPYFGWIDFGGKIEFKTRKREPLVRYFFKEGRILWKALAEKRAEVKATYDRDMQALLRKYQLDK